MNDREKLIEIRDSINNHLAAPIPTPIRVLGRATSPWNRKLTVLDQTDPNTVALKLSLDAETKKAGPWVNGNKYSTAFYKVVDGPRFPVDIIKGAEKLIYTKLWQDCRSVPIPENAVPAAGTDGHCTIWDITNDTLYEFWQLKRVNNVWQASWGGVLRDVSNSDGIIFSVKNAAGGIEYQGATATSLPAIFGTMLVSELAAGKIPHALAFCVVDPSSKFVYPAQRSDGVVTGVIPEGQRFRLPADFVVNPALTPLIKMMVEAVRDYGMILRDRGGAVCFYAEAPKDGSDPLKPYVSGKPLWEVMREFPFSSLVAIKAEK